MSRYKLAWKPSGVSNCLHTPCMGLGSDHFVKSYGASNLVKTMKKQKASRAPGDSQAGGYIIPPERLGFSGKFVGTSMGFEIRKTKKDLV